MAEYENPWTYAGAEVNEIEAPAFVYLIRDLRDGKNYLGKKFTRKRTRKQVGKRRTTVDSDWKRYYSSNEYIKAEAKTDPSRFKREIIALCVSRAEANYLEAEICFQLGVLRGDEWYNDNISGRFFRRNVANYTTKADLTALFPAVQCQP